MMGCWREKRLKARVALRCRHWLFVRAYSFGRMSSAFAPEMVPLQVMVVANDATVKGGTYYPITGAREQRCQPQHWLATGDAWFVEAPSIDLRRLNAAPSSSLCPFARCSEEAPAGAGGGDAEPPALRIPRCARRR
jgi:hypothetical protein